MDERDQVLLQNARFYEAFETRDLAGIEAVWSHAPYVRCIHPGWIVLEGWESVRQSWQNILEGEWQLSVSLRNISVELFGRLAVVVLTEEVVSHALNDVTMIMATNIFEFDGTSWRLIHRHGSPMAMSEQEEDAPGFRYN